MYHNRSEALFSMADELLAAAEQEQQRAEEDVVSYLICVNARQSIANYLAGILLLNDVIIQHPVSMASLLEQCKTIDARFESVDLGDINCRTDTHDRKYCLWEGEVNVCLSKAKLLRSVIFTETPVH